MPGGDVYTESLEQRIERIRKRDEEIEKKHREAEADRLAALQANALVKTTAPDDEDWPKAHKYDNLDFTYDVKSEVDETEKKSSTDEIRLRNRPFKKFAEGEGPPADPTYNFLADAERDGKPATDKTNDSKKDWRGNNNNNGAGNGLNRRSNNNNSFNRGKSGAKAKATNTKQQNSMDDTSSRKSDSDRSSCDEKVKRTKSIEGNWREKSIEEKKKDSDKNEAKLSDGQKKSKINEKPTSTDSSPKAANKLSVHQRLGSKLRSDVNNLPDKLSDLSIEKRGNITVSITKDGEVKSVKLDAAKAIGTGRVGTMRAPVQEQTYQPPALKANTPAIIDSNLNALNLNNAVDYKQYQEQSKQQQQPAIIPVSSNIVNGVPFKLPSIQERLTKNRIFFDDKLKNNANN